MTQSVCTKTQNITIENFTHIAGQIKKVKNEIKDQLSSVRSILSNGDSQIKKIVDFLLTTKGKMLRPSLVILSSENSNNTLIIKMAAAMELIHTASLVHDDIIDNSKIRREKPSLNKQFGINTAVLSGDILYTLQHLLFSQKL